MSFWKTTDGKNATETTGKFESTGGSVIPDNTTCLAMITEAKIDEYQGDEYVSLTWTVAKPQAYQNRKVFQKVRIFDADSKKADKAKQMLAAIDKNAGGSLAKSDTAPSNTTLFGIMQKPMLIKVMVWELNDRTGNWVSSVSPRSNEEPAPAPAPEIADDNLDVPF